MTDDQDLWLRIDALGRSLYDLYTVNPDVWTALESSRIQLRKDRDELRSLETRATTLRSFLERRVNGLETILADLGLK